MTVMRFPDTAIDHLLARIEYQEFYSLRWGYVDGSLPEQEAYDLARSVLLETKIELDPEGLIEILIEQRLLFESPLADGTYGYRSRFAEGVRLLSKLKQLLPRISWAAAANLVSDYRVDARPRLVPRRAIGPAEAIATLGMQSAGLERDIANAILRPSGEELRLSRFQVEAAQRVLEESTGSRGIVVSAGTGSGKTLAFYLPALVSISALIENNVNWVKVLAIYPRRELLKDQFGEVFRLIEQIQSVLQTHSVRSVTLGTFFGLTPTRCEPSAVESAGWTKVAGGYVCPFLLCPHCGEQMLWRQADIEASVERLTCRSSPCGQIISENQVILTRQRARLQPPDIVFTTMEMLHQRLSDTEYRGVLGLGPIRDRRARLVLLDEIHTYEGTTGAQSALALRRWRHANGQPVRFVGLSATLREAPRFLADLTGLPEYAVVEVSPRDEDLDPIGMAYQVILRGDPVSQAGLLSTSIQSSFLLARLMDPADSQRSGGRFGHRVFVFTDDLDVTNRLFDSLRDAEAYDVFGRPNPQQQPLASLRKSNSPDWKARERAGQKWTICEEIGWPLDQRLRISRTTSQDAGVDANSNVVVATSALEVGFDDPGVGGVVQHKSPHRLASFLQRKGRAGRTLKVRPWMVTVLSDYGRDRLTYQAYDQLFDPSLPALRLPVRNRYVLRMQAVFSFMEWLAQIAEGAGFRGWWWRTLNGPSDSSSEREKQKWVRDVLRRLLRNEGDWAERLITHLEQALQLTRDEVLTLLWEPPRSLMLEVFPTISRRLATDWRLAPSMGTSQSTDLKAAEGRVHPLPDFVPSSLFGELNLPEVAIIIPPATTRHEERTETLSIVQTLNEFAPGNVTRRFAFEYGALNHWIAVPLDAPLYNLPISKFAEQHEYIAEVTARFGPEILRIPCFRPWVIRAEKVSKQHVTPTSSARLKWSTELLPTDSPVAFPITQTRGWGQFIRSVDFYLHAFRSAVTMRRFSVEANASIRRPGFAGDLEVHTQFVTEAGEPAAVGFEQDVDGMVVQVSLPDEATLVERASSSKDLPAWRTMYFRDQVLTDPILEAQTNWFQRDWLQQIYLSALVAEACLNHISLQTAKEHLQQQTFEEAYEPVIQTLFRIQERDDQESTGSRTSTGRLEERLRDLLSRTVILDRLHMLSEALWNPDPTAWGAWLRLRAHETLGEAMMAACLAVAPSYAAIETLLLDLDRGTSESNRGQLEIWITESTPGGTGVIESIAETFAADQRALFTALEAALTPSDLEMASTNLDIFAGLVRANSEVASATDRVRRCQDHRKRSAARVELYRLLAQHGMGAHHAFNVALEHRLLREGMDASADQLVEELVDRWQEYESLLGVNIALRVFCYVAVADPDLGPRLRSWLSTTSGTQLSTPEVVGVLAGILWPRPAEIRGRSLESYSPFREQGRTDPSIVRNLLLSESEVVVEYGEPDWYLRLITALSQMGKARIKAARTDGVALHRELLSLIATPIDVDYLQFYPVLEQATVDGLGVWVTVILREVAIA